MPIHKDIKAFNAAQLADDKRICDALAKAIDRHLPHAECKIWHRHPVWFLQGNPIVGYSKLKDWRASSWQSPPGRRVMLGFRRELGQDDDRLQYALEWG